MLCSYSMAPALPANSASNNSCSNSSLTSATLSSESFRIFVPASISSSALMYTSSISKAVLKFSTSNVSSTTPTEVTPLAITVFSVTVNCCSPLFGRFPLTFSARSFSDGFSIRNNPTATKTNSTHIPTIMKTVRFFDLCIFSFIFEKNSGFLICMHISSTIMVCSIKR